MGDGPSGGHQQAKTNLHLPDPHRAVVSIGSRGNEVAGNHDKDDDGDDDGDDEGDDEGDDDGDQEGGGLATQCEVDVENDEGDWADDLSSLGDFSAAEWSHDTDNLHVEGFHNIQDQYSIMSAMPHKHEIEAMHALFVKTAERISEWRLCAHREEEIARPVDCWLGCGFCERVEMISCHVRDDCSHRAKECPDCRRMIPFKDLKRHRAKECLKRKHGCPNAWAGCSEIVPFDFLDTHLHLRCKLRLVPCRKNCNAVIPLAHRDNHELHHCNKRQMLCDVCHGPVIAADFGHHLHHSCPERMVRCSISCGNTFPAKLIDNHEKNECVKACRWGT